MARTSRAESTLRLTPPQRAHEPGLCDSLVDDGVGEVDLGCLGISNACLEGIAQGHELIRVMWEVEPVTITADEAMRPAEGDDERSQREEITDWLHSLLSPGRMKSQEVRTQAKVNGFAWRSVQRLAKASGVAIKREGFGSDTATYWSLSPVAPSRASHASAGTVARVDVFGASDGIERGEL